MNLKEFLRGCKRVLKHAKKPTKEEYYNTLKFTVVLATIFGGLGLILTILFLIA
jgi:protein translocase SEC61 complex gamma subunit